MGTFQHLSSGVSTRLLGFICTQSPDKHGSHISSGLLMGCLARSGWSWWLLVILCAVSRAFYAVTLIGIPISHYIIRIAYEPISWMECHKGLWTLLIRGRIYIYIYIWVNLWELFHVSLRQVLKSTIAIPGYPPIHEYFRGNFVGSLKIRFSNLFAKLEFFKVMIERDKQAVQDLFMESVEPTCQLNPLYSFRRKNPHLAWLPHKGYTADNADITLQKGLRFPWKVGGNGFPTNKWHPSVWWFRRWSSHSSLVAYRGYVLKLEVLSLWIQLVKGWISKRRNLNFQNHHPPTGSQPFVVSNQF